MPPTHLPLALNLSFSQMCVCVSERGQEESDEGGGERERESAFWAPHTSTVLTITPLLDSHTLSKLSYPFNKTETEQERGRCEGKARQGISAAPTIYTCVTQSRST